MQGVTILTWGSGDMMRLLSKLNKLKIIEKTPPPKKKIKTSMAKTMGPFLGSSEPEQMYRLNLPLMGPVNYYFGMYVKSSFVKSVMKTSLNLILN